MQWEENNITTSSNNNNNKANFDKNSTEIYKTADDTQTWLAYIDYEANIHRVLVANIIASKCAIK